MRRQLIVVWITVWAASVGWVGAPVVAAQAESPAVSRVVRYGARDIVPLYGQLRYTTMIVLPPEERILDFICGDKEFWIINGNQNLAYVKPARSGARSNLNLITASGNVYSFLLTEVSEAHGTSPDLKVYVELQEPSMVAAASGPPSFVSAQQVEDYRAQLDLAKADARRATERERTSLEESIAAFRSTYPLRLRFPYRVRLNQKPFYITAMYHDDAFTYIHARATEPSTLYELADGKPNLVNYDYKDGVYIISKIVDRGYLAIGSKRLMFFRAE